MKTIHIIETKEEQELVKRIFDKRVKDGESTNNTVGGFIQTQEDGCADGIFASSAVVYDLLKEGEWMVYDFQEGKSYKVYECDLAGLVDELPSEVFPF